MAAYTEKSTYEYITGDELEEYAIRTYDAVDARYTEAVVMAKVSHAERIVRSLTHTTASTDGIKSLVLELSKYLWELQIFEDYPEEEKEPSPKIFDKLFALLESSESYNPAGPIPMQGIDR